jgi:tight adherence protein B
VNMNIISEVDANSLFVIGTVGTSLSLAAIAVLAIGSESGPLRRSWLNHCATIDRDLRFLWWSGTGKQYALSQLAVSGLSIVLALILFDARWLLVIAAAVLVPGALLRRGRDQRVRALEKQLDGWLLMLANMLTATASVADAVKATRALASPPLAQELDLVVKEMDLGSGLDEALQSMADRVQSRLLRSVLTGLMVGRDTGGELPQVLERTAQSLRELDRLDAVLRSKTSQAKAQLGVLVIAPIVIVYSLLWVDDQFFTPLLTSAMGGSIIAVAVLLWISSLALGRRILDLQP